MFPARPEHPERSPGIPGRLPEQWAKGLIALSLLTAVIAVGGWFLHDGWHRAAFVLAFLTMSVGNLCLGFGSLAEDERRSRWLRQASSALGVVMLLALGAALAFQLCGD